MTIAAQIEQAQRFIPTLSMNDVAHGWLVFEETHMIRIFPNGHFVLREETSKKHGPSTPEFLSGVYSRPNHQVNYATPRTHMLTLVNDKKQVGEYGEMLCFLFMVNLHLAWHYRSMAIRKQNGDGLCYMFDGREATRRGLCATLRSIT